MIIEFIFLGVLYFLLGIGVFAVTKRVKDETPMHFLAVFLLWPILLLMFCVIFLFTGVRIND